MVKAIFILLILLSTPLPSFSAEESGVYTAAADSDNVQRVELTAGSYFFKPEQIIVRAGVPVELVIRNESKVVPHNFVMESPEAGMDFSESLSGNGNLTVVRFTPTRPGKYPFYCDKKLLFFKSHKDRGMEGVVEVR
ncbi:plastocyanin [uncultured bacterium]|nr:plastocyanin [uncultured bacterium]